MPVQLPEGVLVHTCVCAFVCTESHSLLTYVHTHPHASPPDTHTCLTLCSTHVWIHTHSTFVEHLPRLECWAGYSIWRESVRASLGLPLEAGLPGHPAHGVNQREAAGEGALGLSLRVRGTGTTPLTLGMSKFRVRGMVEMSSTLLWSEPRAPFLVLVSLTQEFRLRPFFSLHH